MDPLNETKKPGRTPREIHLQQVEGAASIGGTLEDIGIVVGLSPRQLQRRQEDPKFLKAIERGRAKLRMSLRRAQVKSALDGNVTAQIWLGKQLLGQRSFEKA